MLNTPLTVFAIATAALDIIAVYALPPAFEYVFKPLTMVFIIMIALRAKPADRAAYRRLVLIGLVCSLAGDLFLMLPWDLFTFGLLSFLAAHIFYTAAFVYTTGRLASPVYAAPFLIYGGVMMWVLIPHVGGFMKLPVIIYVAAILLMGWQALNRFIVTRQKGSLLAATGALLFIASDSALAINRFASPFSASSAVVLATYFAAQCFIALSVASAVKEPFDPKTGDRPRQSSQEVGRAAGP